MEFPTGLLTLVFTDIQDSSDLSERYRADFEPLRAEHFRILRDAAPRWNGLEVSAAGDALFLVFANASDAVQWAIEVQVLLTDYDWPMLSSPRIAEGAPVRAEVRIRIGMHTGEPFLSLDATRPDYFGPTVNRAARVSSAAHGGQILLSNATYSLIQFDLPKEITFTDCGLHRLKGVGEDRLWQVHAPNLPVSFPPLKTLDPQRHNLPTLSTTFLGRDNDILNWLEKLREPATRLLTLTGFGGMGKTRSALQLAELSLDDYKDGVWWVEAEEARSGEEMIQRIAGSLRLPPQPDISFREQVGRHLRDHNLLLAIDNAEQIPDAGRVISDLLSQSPKVKFLVTSRRALEIKAERVVELSPLPLSEAILLFVGRVKDRQTDFELTEDNAPDIAELCRRLDGVPLALELAASRIATMAPRQMLQRLNERFKLLQTRAPDFPERQRALRAAIDWSYDILADDEKSLFAQVSVFAGGFTLDDAEAVCEVFDVFEGVAELRRHSLLRSETEKETQQTRFVMLNSLREYAQERLAATGEASSASLRHARYFLKYAQQRLEHLRTPKEAEALRELKIIADNLRAGMEAACKEREIALFAHLGLMRGWAFNLQGLSHDAVEPLQSALDALLPIHEENLTLFAELLWQRAWSSLDQRDTEGADALAKKALELFKLSGDRVGQGRAINLLGNIAGICKRYSEARTLFGEGLKLLQSPQDDTEIGNIHTTWAAMEVMDPEGDLKEAQQLLQKALSVRRKRGDLRGLAETLNNMGIVAYRQEDWKQAWDYYVESLLHKQALGNTFGIASTLFNLAEAAYERGETMRSLRLLAASEFLMEIVKSPVASQVSDFLGTVIRSAGEERTLASLRQSASSKSVDALTAWAMND